jgi:hypothetical protein
MVGDVLEQLQPPVERAVVDEFESDVRVSVEAAVATGGAGDDGEDDDPVTVHQTSAQERTAESEAAQ